MLAKVALAPSGAVDPFVTGGIGWVELSNFGAPRLDARLEARYLDNSGLDFKPRRQMSVFWWGGRRPFKGEAEDSTWRFPASEL